MNPSFNKVTKGLFLACGISCAYMPGAIAEEAVADSDIEIIQVRATKRAENAKDVPMAINVTTGETLVKQGIVGLEDLATSIPNFTVGDSLTTSNVYMRGMGSGADRGFEQSVSMYVNGIYMPRSRQTRASFFDVGHLEVLRGPQSVLFGLNSTAGAVSIHNNKTNPGDDFHFSVLGEYETEAEGYKTDVIIGGSIGDNLGLRLAIREGDSDGFSTTTDPVTGESTDTGGRDESVVRLSAVFQATDDLKIEASYENADFFVTGSIGEIFNKHGSGLFTGLLGVDYIDDDGELDWNNGSDTSIIENINGLTPGVNALSEPGVDQESDNASVNVTYSLGSGSELQANLGYSDYSYAANVDVDSSSAPIWDAFNYEEYEQTSAELLYLSPTDGDFSYIVGAYYQTSDFFTSQPNVFDMSFLSALGLPPVKERGDNPLTVEQTLMSAYFSADYKFTDDLTLIAGVRWTDEEKDWDRGAACQWDMGAFMDTSVIFGTGDFNPGGALVCSPAGYNGNSDETLESDNVMPEVTLKYRLNDDTSVYIKAGQSAKSGGIATAGTILASNLVYDDETVTGIEAGLKTSFLDDNATLNLTVFHSQFDDLQVKSSIITEDGKVKSIATNAGESTTQGVELDFSYMATDWLTVGTNVAYLSAEYDTFNDAPCDQFGDNPVQENGLCDLSGQTMPFAPEVSANVFADIYIELTSSLALQGGVNVSYSDEYFTEGTLQENVKQDSYSKINARIGIADVEGTWEVNLIGNNLTDEEILVGTQPLTPFGYELGYLAAPTTVTLQGVYRFGG